MVLRGLIHAVIGPLVLERLLQAEAGVHRRLAHSPRARQPHIGYPLRR
jgi:hypothetical protein